MAEPVRVYVEGDVLIQEFRIISGPREGTILTLRTKMVGHEEPGALRCQWCSQVMPQGEVARICVKRQDIFGNYLPCKEAT
jgi:hypothetical protein